jgi:hypothetical protein
VENQHAWGPDAVVAEMRADVRHLASDMTELRQDVRRIDGRVLQMLLLQVATLATLLAALVTALVA